VALTADSDAAEQVLQGTYEPPEGTAKYAVLLLQQERAMPESIQRAGPIKAEISADEHVSGWKKQKERTSSEPLGL
jgi:hypothetical protein